MRVDTNQGEAHAIGKVLFDFQPDQYDKMSNEYFILYWIIED